MNQSPLYFISMASVGQALAHKEQSMQVPGTAKIGWLGKTVFSPTNPATAIDPVGHAETQMTHATHKP